MDPLLTELSQMGVSRREVSLIRSKDGVTVARGRIPGEIAGF